MAQEKEERHGAAAKKTSEAADDSIRRSTGTQSRYREPASGGPDTSIPGRRRGRYPIGTLLPLRSVPAEVSIRVIGERDQPLASATVVIDGGGLPAQALTDETGTARLTFFGGTVEAVQTLFIRAAANHWDRLISSPRLSSGTNTVKLRPLSETYPGFPAARLHGWGQRLMGVDQIGRASCRAR